LKQLFTIHAKYIFILYFIAHLFPAVGQPAEEADTSVVSGHLKVKAEINKVFPKAFIPGLVQFERKQYWKIPVVYGGISALAFMGFQQNHKYKKTITNFNNIFKENAPVDYFVIYNSDKFKEQRQDLIQSKWLRNAFWVGAGAMYTLNIADAIRPIRKDYHSPHKAALYSALVPGLGQAYNDQYWKIPLVYAGFGAFAYFIHEHHTIYQETKEAYLLRQKYQGEYRGLLDDTGNEFAGEDNIRDERLLEVKDKRKRWRNQVILATFGFYLVNVADASVFGHFYHFDVSKDLSYSINPVVIPSPNVNNSLLGINFALNF
jgi:hypothetical protein